MKKSEYNIGMFGTFDVANYGDLLFPIIAERELKKRLGPVNLYKFSYHAKHTPEWPFDTISLTELPDYLNVLDGVLIGGGHIIRFDKNIAIDYKPSNPTIHHPTGYWLTPSLLALQYGIPVIWNAPSLQDDIPDWALPLLKLSLHYNQYTSVRDTLSKNILFSFTEFNDINIVPDTVFGINQLINPEAPTPEFNQLREKHGLTGPYIIIQATSGLEAFLKFINKQGLPIFENMRILALPMGPALGDKNELLMGTCPEIVFLPKWPNPLIIAELICHATAVVGQSLHMAITALSFEVPVFSSAPMNSGKYKILSSFENLSPLPEEEISFEWFIKRMSQPGKSMTIKSLGDSLDNHWNRIAAIVQKETVNSTGGLNQFWQSLPHIFENYEISINSKDTQLGIRDEQIRLKDEQLKKFYNSRSWKITSPLRSITAYLQKNKGDNQNHVKS